MDFSLLFHWAFDNSFEFCMIYLKSFLIYSCDAMVKLTFHMAKSFCYCFLSNKANRNYFEEISHDCFCHKFLSKHSILSGIFILRTNFCVLLVFLPDLPAFL